jgi:endonuclease-3
MTQHIPRSKTFETSKARGGHPIGIPTMLAKIDESTRSLPKAAMFELADRGFTTAFEQLVACILSIRTYDETSLPAAERLLIHAGTAAELSRLSATDILSFIQTVTFAQRKAAQILEIAISVRDRYRGELPCDPEVMQSFSGVGPKCANLAAGIACGLPMISVDVHVHRITNRWGLVHTASPTRTMVELEKAVPSDYWVELNRLLVPFGKHICTGRLPRCSGCPVRDVCARVGVTDHR